MQNSADARRRWLGTISLACAAGLLIWGQTVFRSRLRGGWFLLYYAVCFAFTLGAIVIALLDVRAVRRRVRDEQRELIEQARRDAAEKTRDEPRE